MYIQKGRTKQTGGNEMKIKKEDYENLKTSCLIVLKNHPNAVSEYRAGRYPNSERTKDVNRRFAFDVLHASHFNTTILYKYLNDENIYSALKRFLPVVI